MATISRIRHAPWAPLVAAGLLIGCGDAPEPETVEVWFTRSEAPVAVERPAAAYTVESALRALVHGPTEEEWERGMSSWFGDGTGDVLRSVEEANGSVVIDFDPALRERAPGAATSAGSRALLLSLDSTVFQFPWVHEAEYRMDGSCDAFWNWLQRECGVVRRR